MRTGVVEVIGRVNRKAFRITLDDGRSLVCTEQHPWLTKNNSTDVKWRSITKTNRTAGKIKVGAYVRWITKPWGEVTLEDGWFGGMLDGEGSISKKNSSANLVVSQRHGKVWDRLLKYAIDRGYNYRIEADKAERKSKFGKVPVPKLCFGRMDELFRLIGTTRPTRFIENRFWEGRELPGKKSGIGWAKVVSIEELGYQEMIDLQTSTGTYIAEGFVSHNTSFACVEAFDTAVFEPGSYCGIMADKRERVKDIFTIVRRTYKLFTQDWGSLIPLDVGQDNLNELVLKDRDSAIKVAFDFKGYTLKRLHVSEAAFIDDKRITESSESVPYSGRITMETTPNGMQGYFFKQWQLSMSGQGTYKRHFFPWFEHYPEQSITVPDKVVWTEKETELRKEFNLSEDKLLWRRWKVADLNNEEDEFDRLYPADEVSCFLAGADQIFPQIVIRRLYKYMTEPNRRVTLSQDGAEIRVSDDKDSPLWVWESPKPGEIYCIGADPSEGVGKDFGAVIVIRHSTGKVVAEMMVQADPDQFANILWKVGRWYNTASICVEVNNHGHACIQALSPIYSKLYKRRTVDERTLQPTKKIGFLTTRESKVTIINNLKSAIRDGDTLSNSSRLITQMTTFVRSPNGAYSAQPGSHDDLVMAYALAWEQKRNIAEAKNDEDRMDNVKINPITGFIEAI